MADGFDPSNTSGAPSPFQRIFDPAQSSQGGLAGALGLAGRAFGVPSHAERESQMQADVFSKLSGYYDQTKDPQKAIVQFIQSPDGINLMSRPGGIATLNEWAKTITPPNPQQYVTPAGTRSDFGQNGKMLPGAGVAQAPTESQNFNNGVPHYDNAGPGTRTTPFVKGQPQTNNSVAVPTAQDQTFTSLVGKMGQLDPATLSALAINELNPNEVQQRNLAITSMVKAGTLTPDEGNKFTAGMIVPIEITNVAGEATGQYMLFDKAAKRAYAITPTTPGSGQPSAYGNPQGQGDTQGYSIPTTAPGQPAHQIRPEWTNPDGSINADKLSDKKYMGFGVGPGSKMLTLNGVALRWADPTNAEPRSLASSAQAQQLQNLDTMLTSVGAQQGGRLKVQTDSWRQQGPGTWTDPLDAYRKLVILHNNITSQIASENQIINNRMSPKESIKTSFDTVQALRNVLEAMPTVAESQQMIKDIKAGTSPAVTPATVINSTVDSVGNLVNSGRGTYRAVTGDQQKPDTQLGKIYEMQAPELSKYGASLPPGPSAARSAYEARIKQLLQSNAPKAPGKQSQADGSFQVAGDVIDRSQEFKNLQQSNAITRSLSRKDQEVKPKAPVVPLLKKQGANPFSQVA